MDAISGADRLVALLRKRLDERARAAPPAKAGTRGPTDRSAARVDTVRAMAAYGEDERQLKRAFIQTILADGLGEELLNSARFQQVVDRVTATIEEDAESASLLAAAVAELKTKR